MRRTRTSAGFALALLLTLLALLVAPSVSAQERGSPTLGDAAQVRAASKKFQDGERAYRAGDYTLAGDLFEGAYALAPHADALWNAARAWHRAGEKVRAANLYARFPAKLRRMRPTVTTRRPRSFSSRRSSEKSSCNGEPSNP